MTDETNTNRWTAKVVPSRYYHFKVAVVSDRGRTVPIDRLTDEQAESLAEQINRPAPTAPADGLPPGVERISDGTYWFPIRPDLVPTLPEGWVWSYPDSAVEVSETVMVQVRPTTPAEPATEWVPLHEALRDRRKIRANGIAWVTCCQVRMLDGRVQVGTPGIGWALVNADGKVEVQR